MATENVVTTILLAVLSTLRAALTVGSSSYHYDWKSDRIIDGVPDPTRHEWESEPTLYVQVKNRTETKRTSGAPAHVTSQITVDLVGIFKAPDPYLVRERMEQDIITVLRGNPGLGSTCGG